MCGIAGMVGLDLNTQTAEKMYSTMYRRGPDGWGIYRDRDCAMLHARLAIIDPEGGSQPMHVSWDGEQYTIVYNGELYNTAQVCSELCSLGHIFFGHSDTEVVLHAFAQWKECCLEKLNGIFAFGIWMKNKRELFLARDRIGVKPLFYARIGAGIIFASEIKTILCHPRMDAVLDKEGAAQILLLGPGRIPGSGVFRDILELEPGSYGKFREGAWEVRQYWRLTDGPHTDSFPETSEKVCWLVTDAIRSQMISDVPIGTFLSGGLDSSIISALCAKEAEKQGKRLKTFSVDYRNNDRYFIPGKFQPNSDSTYIDIMLNSIHTDHTRTELTPEDLDHCLEAATIARDLPGMADVDFSLLAFCREIRRQVKVGLSGECADEIFGGYPWFRDPEIREKAGFPWAQTTAQRCSLIVPGVLGTKEGEAYVMDQYRKTCLESDICPEASALERRMKEMVNLNFRWFMQTLLDRKDRMSMYSGLEVRVPFCDYRIAEYLYRVPWEYKNYQGREKGLLRYAFRELLPEEIIQRKKSPYPKTFDPRYEQLMTARMDMVMQNKNAPIWQLVNREKLKQLLSSDMTWPWYGQLMRRPQTIAYFVQLNFWLEHYRIQFSF